MVEAFAAAGHGVLAPARHLPAAITAAEAAGGLVDCLIDAAGAERGPDIDALLETVLPGMRRRRCGTIIHIDPTGEARRAVGGEPHVRVIRLIPRPGRHAYLAPAELARIALFCYRLPQRVCVRDLILTPTGV